MSPGCDQSSYDTGRRGVSMGLPAAWNGRHYDTAYSNRQTKPAHYDDVVTPTYASIDIDYENRRSPSEFNRPKETSLKALATIHEYDDAIGVFLLQAQHGSDGYEQSMDTGMELFEV